MIIVDKPKTVILADGQQCEGHMMPINTAVLFEDIPRTEIDKAPDATHALTIRYREDVSKGDVVEYDGERWEVLSAFDPAARIDYNPRADNPGDDQKRKFLKALVKKGA